jgi:hypothetical protein
MNERGSEGNVCTEVKECYVFELHNIGAGSSSHREAPLDRVATLSEVRASASVFPAGVRTHPNFHAPMCSRG